MKIIYDPETDTLDLIFRDDPVAESDEIRDGIIIDYNKYGKIVSVEILSASEHIVKPNAIAYEVTSLPTAVHSKTPKHRI